MSRFFAAENNGSSESESEGSETEMEKIKSQAQKDKMKKRGEIMQDLESSGDEEKHVVVSEKDKRQQKLKELVEKLKEKMKINDFVSLLNNFEELNKEAEKSQKVYENEGGVPRFYIRTLCSLQNFVLSISAEDKKKLSTNNNKSFNALKQKIKKHNANYQLKIDEFLANPVDSDAERKEQQNNKQKPNKQGTDEPQDEEDEDEEEDEEEQEEDADDDEYEDDKYLLQSSDPMVRRRYWLKKVVEEKEIDEDAVKEDGKGRGGRQHKPSKKDQIDYDIKFSDQANVDIKLDYSGESVNKLLAKIVETRGKQGVDQIQNIMICEKFIQYFNQKDLKKTLEIVLITLQLQIDQAKAEGTHFITRKAWHNIYQNIVYLYTLYHVQEVHFDSLNTYSKYDRGAAFTELRLVDTLIIYFSLLDSELNKGFQNLDFFTQEYCDRLIDLYSLIHLAQKLSELCKVQNQLSNLAKLSFKELELCYYFSNPVIEKIKANAQNIQQNGVNSISPAQVFTQDIETTVSRLVANVYNGGEEDLIRRATLFWVFNLGLHGRYEQARDLMFRTISQEVATTQRALVQVHYNRGLVQLGLAAFRKGLIQETSQHLSDLVNRDKNIRDLLAQNYTKGSNDPDVARFNLPYHQSINIELVETVQLLSTTLLEVSNVHSYAYEDQQRILNRKFRQFMNFYDQQPFNANPGNSRDFIYAASKQLGKGDWNGCWQNVQQLQFWSKLPNLAEIQVNLLKRIKEFALKCYLFTFRNCFTSISMHDIAAMFELPLPLIRTIVFRMIYYRELHARIEGGEGLQIMFQKQETTQTNRVTLELVEKINILAKNNEKILDAKAGSYGFQNQEKEPAEGIQRGHKSKQSSQYNYNQKKEEDLPEIIQVQELAIQQKKKLVESESKPKLKLILKIGVNQFVQLYSKNIMYIMELNIFIMFLICSIYIYIYIYI